MGSLQGQKQNIALDQTLWCVSASQPQNRTYSRLEMAPFFLSVMMVFSAQLAEGGCAVCTPSPLYSVVSAPSPPLELPVCRPSAPTEMG